MTSSNLSIHIDKNIATSYNITAIHFPIDKKFSTPNCLHLETPLNSPLEKLLKDTHRERAPSNKTPALTKSTNMDVWTAGTLSQLFIRGS